MFKELISKVVSRALISPVSKAVSTELRNTEQKSQAWAVPLGWNEYRKQSKPDVNVNPHTLRQMSIHYPVARACINYRKRQITQLEWDIVSVDDTEPSEQRVKDVKGFFEQPSGHMTRFRELLDYIIEDLLVLDAVTLEKAMTIGGDIVGLLPVDSATILLLVDENGRTPQPPDVAYKQIIRGEIVAELTTDEMIYEMLNPRTNTPYGLSPLESLVLIVNSALKSEMFNLKYLTEGNIPEGFLEMPSEMISTPEQMKEMQQYWNAMTMTPSIMTGLKVVPQGSKYTPSKKPNDMSFEKFELWLLQLTCAVFGVPPQDIGFTYQVNKATAETQYQLSSDTALKPLAKFVKEIFDDVIKQYYGDDLQFKWTSLETRDEVELNDIYTKQINSGLRSIDEIRVDEGLEPIGVSNFVMSGGTPYFLGEEADAKREKERERMSEVMQPKEEEEKKDEVIEELQKWQRFVLNRLKAKKKLRAFESEIIPAYVQKDINFWLKGVESPLDAMKAFDPYLSEKGKLITQVEQLRNNLDDYIRT